MEQTPRPGTIRRWIHDIEASLRGLERSYRDAHSGVYDQGSSGLTPKVSGSRDSDPTGDIVTERASESGRLKVAAEKIEHAKKSLAAAVNELDSITGAGRFHRGVRTKEEKESA